MIRSGKHWPSSRRYGWHLQTSTSRGTATRRLFGNLRLSFGETTVFWPARLDLVQSACWMRRPRSHDASVLCFRDQQGALMLPKSQIPQAYSLCCGVIDAPSTVAPSRFAVHGAGFWLSGLDRSRVSSSVRCYSGGTQTLSVASSAPPDGRVILKTGIETSCNSFREYQQYH